MQNNLPDKKACRQEGKCRRAALLPEERKAAEQRILDRICSMECYREAENLLVYASYLDEVSTWELMERALQDQKKVYCPRTVVTDAGEKRLDFYRIFRTEDLLPGFRGIREPEADESRRWPEKFAGASSCGGKPQQDTGRDLIIIPGCAFDRNLRRLGYGGGFYDRFLAGFSDGKRPVTAAICFSCQILEELPEEETDIRPDFLVTEDEIIERI